LSVLKVNQIQTANGVIMANLNSSGANIGFQLASTLAPAFSAYQSSSQTLSSSTATKITFTTEEFDTNNNFASSTFTPTVAGYYQINALVSAQTTYTTGRAMVYKNGSEFKRSNTVQTSGGAFLCSCLVYCNGSTDYIEVYGFFGTGQAVQNTQAETYFQASMVRSA